MSEIDQRLFGRVSAALLECPHCGEIWDIRAGARLDGQHKGRRKHQGGLFDALTGQFRCRACGGRAVLGLVVYLVEEGDREVGAPRDWQATIKERIRIRDAARARVSGEGWKARRVHKGANQIRGGEK